MRPTIASALLTALAASSFATGPVSGERYERRWFYSMSNLQVADNADKLIALIERAKKSGYNGVVLADYKLNILDRVPDHYFRNVERVQKAAQAAGVEIVPAVFPIGYSNGLLAHDPNLAEGLPVVNAPFVVRGREAALDPAPASIVANGGFEDSANDRFAGFNSQDGPGKSTFADREVKRGGQTSCRFEANGPDINRRVIQRVAVRPGAAYRLSAWVKTRGLSDPTSFRLLAIGAAEKGRSLTFFEGGVAATQDWKKHDVVFNSFDHESVNVYAGLWGQGRGTAWVDDLTLEELGPVNVLRRPGCPVTVTSDDGATRYEEGRDYGPLVDPKLGTVPYAGEFEFEHAAPPLRLTANSRIQDGQRLRVSWYHPVLVHGSQIMACPSEEKMYAFLRDQARRVNELLRPSTFFMSHDEVRVLNWCQACQSRKLTAGQILADNARRCVAILKEVSPGAEVVVWSDMFDPNHNAIDNYYLVNGTLAESWEGLDKAVIVANWNGGRKRPSLDFFAARGHRQVIAGYYDADDLSGFTSWDQAARGVPGVEGFMYTTWRTKYDLLETYGEAMRK